MIGDGDVRIGLVKRYYHIMFNKIFLIYVIIYYVEIPSIPQI